jgi:ATP-dependent RNA helicase DHX8/PRP22
MVSERQVLAEFIISIHRKSKDVNSFKTKLAKTGAEFPDTFVENLDRLINTLGPKKKSKKGKEKDDVQGQGAAASKSAWEDDETAEKRQEYLAKFPGLAAKDDSDRVKHLVEEMEHATKKVADDTMGGFEDLEGFLRSKKMEANARDDERAKRGRSRSRSRSRSPKRRQGDDNDYRRDHRDRDRGRERRYESTPVVYKIYDGRVTSIRDFGAFVQLEGFRGKVEGMVHISSIKAGPGKVAHPSDVVSRNQRVKVKVMSIAGSRMGLSMKDVDQDTGKDLSPHLRVKTQEELDAESLRNPDRPIMTSFSEAPIRDDIDTHTAAVKRISSPERWEIKQLIASGVLDPKDYPTFDEEQGLLNYEDKEEDLDIEIREEEPSFLKGQTKNSLQLSPVKIVKNPDGTLNRAALAGASLAKERREIKQQQTSAEFDAVPKDLNRPWVDPMPEPGERVFSQDLKGFGQMEPNIPAWKKATFNNATTFGKITSLTIKEQRESLPIYKLREELVKAVDDNQVLIVVGDTGSGKVGLAK